MAFVDSYYMSFLECPYESGQQTRALERKGKQWFLVLNKLKSLIRFFSTYFNFVQTNEMM